ncbi:MAG: rod shape-determining protein MreC [Candidatus Edwardsbacteria bacterium]|nr:rod shape-determining protein MreC [Candidatus Edwardsbacteria bacterium]
MPFFPSKLLRRQDIAALAAFLLACLSLMILPAGLKQVIGDGVVRIFFAPLELPALQLKALLGSWRENNDLRQELAQVKLENIALTQARRENDRLRSLLGFKSRLSWTVVAAQVSGREPALLTPDLRIDKGAASGLGAGMIAFSTDGVVGRITGVQPDAATVQTIFDPQSRVSAIDHRSRVLGVFRTVKGSRCILDRVPVRSDVREGDTIVTSGYGQLFPFGLPLGVIDKVAASNRSLTYLITVRPALDVNRLNHLFVITGGTAPALPVLETAAVPGGEPARPRRERASSDLSPALRLNVPQLRIELPDTLKLQPERGQ